MDAPTGSGVFVRLEGRMFKLHAAGDIGKGGFRLCKKFFRIFFSESFTIAMINFVLTVLGLFLITEWINGVIRNGAGLLITVLGFGLRQILLVLAISILVAAVASFIPVKRIASKKPIDAIRDR